jgi:hypothetical protein
MLSQTERQSTKYFKEKSINFKIFHSFFFFKLENRASVLLPRKEADIVFELWTEE